MIRALVHSVLLLSIAALAAGCGGLEGEGTLDLRVPEFFGVSFNQGAFSVRIRMGKCEDPPSGSRFRDRRAGEDSETYARRRREFWRERSSEVRRSRERCRDAYDVAVHFKDRGESHIVRAFKTRCRNLADERIRCVGEDGGEHPDLGPLRFVSLIKGSRVLGFQIWELASDHGRLVATFGLGADYVPRR